MIPTWVAVVAIATVAGTVFGAYTIGLRHGRRVVLMGVEWVDAPRHRRRRTSRHLWRRLGQWLGFIV